MPKVDEAAIGAAGVMGGGALIVSVLGAKTPPASLPQGALLDGMSGLVSAAPEAVGKLGFGAMPPLAQDSPALQVIFSRLYVGWPLSGEDARDVLVARRKEGGRGRRWGAGDEEVLLEAGTNGARRKAALHCE